jgi:hypothetical protein
MRSSPTASFILALLTGFLGAESARAQSPVGSWDIVIGGRYQRGAAQVSFNPDGTIEGTAVFTINGSRLVHTNSGFVYRHIFGSAEVEGGWVRDGGNRITGYLNLIGADEEDEPVMSGFSLRGTARETRLNLVAHGAAGRLLLRGVPPGTNVVELDGVTHVAEARIRGVPFSLVELFIPSTLEPNLHTIAGNGPGYSFEGTLIISRQRYAAISQDRGAGAPGPRIAAYAGPYNSNRRRGTLRGSNGSNTNIRYRFEPAAP